jgi:Putative antitoxin of bacterial toxin-antitoxin system, YdaS/YdaT
MADILKLAITAAGGPQAFAEKCGASAYTVRRWQRDGTLPIEHVETLVEAGGGFVPKRELAVYLADRAHQRRREAERRAARAAGA